jgi:hypothetical protein
MNCQCCNKQKARITAQDSQLVKGNKLLLCTECRKAGHEPRYFVVIAARSGKNVREFVVGARYCGAELTANEVIA